MSSVRQLWIYETTDRYMVSTINWMVYHQPKNKRAKIR
ncbi:hypothetical protein LCGC14_3158850, partial [marine sediment metagenome]